MIYQRMKYPSDQREWVRAADEKLPELRAMAADAQYAAQTMFDYLQMLPPERRSSVLFLQVQEIYAEAMMLLNRVLYYENMRRLNL